MNRLSDETGIHVSTISRIIKGQNTKGPTKEVITTLAKALRKPVKEVGEWSNAAWASLDPYKPPAVADLLTQEQRSSVDSIIRAFAASNKAMDAEVAKRTEIEAELAERPKAARAQSRPAKAAKGRSSRTS